MSQAAAAELIGCSVRTVETAVNRGLIVSRPHHGERPGVNRASAEVFAVSWQQRQHRRAEVAAARAAAMTAGTLPGWNDPPTDEDVWLDTNTVAAMLGATPIWVARLAFAGRVPATRGAGRRWWFRRSDAEVYAAARVFMRQQAAQRTTAPRAERGVVRHHLKVA